MEERNELMEQQGTNQEVAENAEENQTPVVVEDNFGAGLLIGGGAVLLAGVAVKAVKKLRNKRKAEETGTNKVVTHWYDRFKHAKPEKNPDEPIDVEASEEESEDEE